MKKRYNRELKGRQFTVGTDTDTVFTFGKIKNGVAVIKWKGGPNRDRTTYSLLECFNLIETGAWELIPLNIYFTIDYDTDDIYGVLELTGRKSINIYTIKNNKPRLYGIIESTVQKNTLEEIIDYMGDIDYQLTAL